MRKLELVGSFLWPEVTDPVLPDPDSCDPKRQDPNAKHWLNLSWCSELEVEERCRRERRRVENLSLRRRKQSFSCFGCSFKSYRISPVWNHIESQVGTDSFLFLFVFLFLFLFLLLILLLLLLQRYSKILYECKKCKFTAPSKCVLKRHILIHNYEGDYQRSIQGGNNYR